MMTLDKLTECIPIEAWNIGTIFYGSKRYSSELEQNYTIESPEIHTRYM